MRQRHILSAIVTALIAAFMTSCSSKGDLLDEIPADVAMVARLNADKLCSAMGITLKADGNAEMLPPVHEIFGDGSGLPGFLAAAKAEDVADIDNMVIAIDTDNVTYGVATVNDAAKLENLTSEYLDWSDAPDGYRTARMASTSLLLKADRVWMVKGARDAAKSLGALSKRAGEMSVGKLDGVSNALAADNIANIAVASGFASLTTSSRSNTEIPAQDKEWNMGYLNSGADNSLILDFELMQSTGRSIKPKGMQRINPALLAYVPENFNVTLAAGLTTDFEWQPLRSLVMLAGGFQTAAFMSVVNPYLESIDGTVLMAAAPAEPSMLAQGDVSDWDFIVLAHMPQDKINSLMSMIRDMMSNVGMTPAMTADGLMAIPQYGKTMFIGNVDGYLGVSTIGFDNTRNNSLAPVFVNKDLAANLSLSPLSAYMEDAPSGTALSLSASMDNGKGQIKLKADGTEYPVLVFLMSALL